MSIYIWKHMTYTSNVTIIWGNMCMSVHTFWVQTSLCRQPCLEMEVHKKRLHTSIVVLHSRNVCECPVQLHEPLDGCTIHYWAVARWVQAFVSGRVSIANMHCSGCSVSTDILVAIIEQCKDEDWHRSVAVHRGISGSTALQTLRQNLKVCKTVAKWVPHHLKEVQQWTCYKTWSILKSTVAHGPQ